MKSLLSFLLVAFTGSFAQAAQSQVDFENQIRDRVYHVVSKVDPSALIQPKVVFKKISATLPGLDIDAKVIPLDYDGGFGTSSLESVTIRIVTRLDPFPEWIQQEVSKAAQLEGVKMNITYEKAAGEIEVPEAQIAKVITEQSGPAVEILKQLRTGVWGLIGGIVFMLAAMVWVLANFASRLEKTFGRLVEEKVVPAMQANRGGGANIQQAAAAEDKPERAAQLTGNVSGGGSKELDGIPDAVLASLFSDCYWTSCDRYAHYLWNQLSQPQKEKLLDSGIVDPNYFSYFRKFEPANLGYHTDARYFMTANDFTTINQVDLAKWLKSHTEYASRLTPMRWDLLPISLEDRLKLSSLRQATTKKLAAAASVTKSALRELPISLEIDTLSAEDEAFIWKNHQTIPEQLRGSLKTLAWLALSSLDYRTKVLGDLDARQLAEAWVGPSEVLEKLREAVPAKKLEMMEHFRKETRADRNGAVFKYLFDAGLRAPKPAAAETKLAATPKVA